MATLPVASSGTSGQFSWSGILADGSRAPAGAYVLKLTAEDANGNALPATLQSLGTVQDVVQRNGELWLGLGGQVSLPLSALTRVSASLG